jgi:hypothetical protein
MARHACSAHCAHARRRDDRPALRLRGGRGSKTQDAQYLEWHRKFPLGMRLHEAAGGVGPGAARSHCLKCSRLR